MGINIYALASWGFTLIVLLTLIASIYSNRFRLLNGVIGNVFIVALAMSAAVTVVWINNPILNNIAIILALIFTVFIVFLYLSLGFLLLWNAAIVWRRESHSLANMLTLFLGLYVILSPFVYGYLQTRFPSVWMRLLVNLATAVVLYLLFWFFNFVTSFIISRIAWPRYNKQYIIVLGAGLMNGREVTPLLASRINRAIKFSKKQIKKTGLKPLLIMSGGNGSDEAIPEGQAMRDYAIAQGVPADDVVAETKSKNTYENMRNSKEIVEAHHLDPKYGVFSTSDFHTFRAAGYARYVGLKINGLSAKTSRFFIPNAFLREYVAILFQHKKFHAIAMFVILVGTTYFTFKH